MLVLGGSLDGQLEHASSAGMQDLSISLTQHVASMPCTVLMARQQVPLLHKQA